MHQKTIILFSMISIAAFSSLVSASERSAVPVFEKSEWENRITESWNRKDLNLIRATLSRIYLDAGMSREDVVQNAVHLFEKYEKITCRYRVFWVRQFANNRLASIKMMIDLKGVPADGSQPIIIKQTMGYSSLIFEDGQWKMYAVQFFCDPRVPNFSFDKDVGNWPDFNTQIHLTTYEPARKFSSPTDWQDDSGTQPASTQTSSSTFDKSEWERRVAEGWNRKDAALIMSCFSKLYNEVGVSIDDVSKPIAGFFERYDKLICRYRILSFKPIAGTNLASVKAIMEMSGIPAGQKELVTFIQTMGYASLIFEDGQWKMFASQLFYSPRVPRFNFDAEQGNWPPWGTVVDLNP